MEACWHDDVPSHWMSHGPWGEHWMAANAHERVPWHSTVQAM
jgi:hypothetical protein